LLQDSGVASPCQGDRDVARTVVDHVTAELGCDFSAADRYLRDISRFSSPGRDREERIFARLVEARTEMLRAAGACVNLSTLLEEQSTTRDEHAGEDPDDEPTDDLENEAYALPDRPLSDPEPRSSLLSFATCCRALEQVELDHSDPVVAALDQALSKYARARDRAMEGALKLVPWVARRYHQRGLPLEDLIQEGNLGLMRALEKFDPIKGVRFATYATFWIRQSILRAIADHSRTIRIPVHVGEVLRKAVHIRNSIRAEHNRDATVEELANRLEKSPAAAERILALPRIATNSVPVGMVDESVREPDRRYDEECLQRNISGQLGILPARSEFVVRLRFGLAGLDEHTLEEVGELFDLTRERIRQIESKALRILRHPSRSRLLQAFL